VRSASQVAAGRDCHIVDMPDCHVTHHWAYEWVNVTDEERRRRAQIWGLRDSDLDQFIKWTTERQRAGEIGYPSALRTLDTARDLLRRFQSAVTAGTCWAWDFGGQRRELRGRIRSDPRERACSCHCRGDQQGTRFRSKPAYHRLRSPCLEVDGFHSWFCSLPKKDVSRSSAFVHA